MMGPRSHRPVATGLAALLVIPVALGVRSDSTVASAVVAVLVILAAGGWGGRAWLDRRRRLQMEQHSRTDRD
jgi:hypothetical protein